MYGIFRNRKKVHKNKDAAIELSFVQGTFIYEYEKYHT